MLGPLGVTVRIATIGTTPTTPQEPEVATVKLVQAVRVPKRTGEFVEVEVECPLQRRSSSI